MPPRLSTGSVLSFTWLGTSRTAITSATATSGRVMRNTEPHQKCSSSKPASNGPSAAMPPPSADHSAIDFVRPGPLHSAVISASVVGYAMPGREAAEQTRREQHLVGRRVRREQTGRHRQHHAQDQQQLAAVAVAEGAEVQHRCRQPQRVADRDQVERGLRRVERLADRRQRDVRDRQVQVRDARDQDQRDEDEPRALRCGGGSSRVHGDSHITTPRARAVIAGTEDCNGRLQIAARRRHD